MSVSRRDMLGGALGLAIVGVWWKISDQPPTDIKPLLIELCDLTIPATETPGAVAAGVPAFVQESVITGLLGVKGDILETLSDQLDKTVNGTFMSRSRQRRELLLEAHDSKCFSPEPPKGMVWPDVKKLILMGYYTSEAGASQELRYELDRGGFTADMAFHPGDRAFMNNWFGLLL